MNITDHERHELVENLSAMKLTDLIGFLSWNDANGEFDDATFNDVVDIIISWFWDDGHPTNDPFDEMGLTYSDYLENQP